MAINWYPKATLQKRADAKKAAVNDVLERFSSLPDEAHVRLPVVMALKFNVLMPMDY